MEEPGNKKILAVEDERLQLDILEAFLKNETGCEIITANNGKEAIEIINNQDISLILTDLMMPEIGGLELIKYVNKKSLNIPIIVMTSTTFLNSAIESFRFGAYDYLIKPYEFDILRTVIHRALEKTMLIQKAKEAEKLQILNEIGVALNHEINNHLTGIMGYLEILHDDLPDDKEEIKKGLNLALESSKNIADVIKKFQNIRRYVTTEYAGFQPMLDIKKV